MIARNYTRSFSSSPEQQHRMSNFVRSQHQKERRRKVTLRDSNGREFVKQRSRRGKEKHDLTAAQTVAWYIDNERSFLVAGATPASFRATVPSAVYVYAFSTTEIVLGRRDILEVNFGSMLDLPEMQRSIEFDAVYKILRNDDGLLTIGTHTATFQRTYQKSTDIVLRDLAQQGLIRWWDGSSEDARNPDEIVTATGTPGEWRQSFRPFLWITGAITP